MTPDKELQYQARIRELREALNCPNCPNQGWYEVNGTTFGCCGKPNDDGSCCGLPVQTPCALQQQCEWCHTTPNSRFRVLSRPDDLSALNDYVMEEKRTALMLLADRLGQLAWDAKLDALQVQRMIERMAEELK